MNTHILYKKGQKSRTTKGAGGLINHCRASLPDLVCHLPTASWGHG